MTDTIDAGAGSGHACDAVQLDLVEYMYGGLDAVRRGEVEAAIAGCAACRETFAGFASVRSMLDELPAAPAVEEAPVAAPRRPLMVRGFVRFAAAAMLGTVAFALGVSHGVRADSSERERLAGQLMALRADSSLDSAERRAEGRAVLADAAKRLAAGTERSGAVAAFAAAESALAAGRPDEALARLASVAVPAEWSGAAAHRSLRARARLASARAAYERGEFAGALESLRSLDGSELAVEDRRAANEMLARLDASAEDDFAPLRVYSVRRYSVRKTSEPASDSGLVRLVSEYPHSAISHQAFDEQVGALTDAVTRRKIEDVERRSRIQQQLIRYQSLALTRPDLAPYAHWQAARLLEQDGRVAEAHKSYLAAAKGEGRLAALAAERAEALRRDLVGEVADQLQTIIRLQNRLKRLTNMEREER